MLLQGDCRNVLPTLEAESVQTCITSPPYWGLRDYGTAQWEGGEAECDHRQTDEEIHRRYFANSTLEGGQKTQRENANSRYRCHCGARRIDAQIGLEETPDAYIAKMVAVFREVWRVLRDDGTCWINLGSSYASGDKLPNRSRSDVPAYGIDGKELLNSQWPDLSCFDLCDGCRAAIGNRRQSNAGNDLSMQQSLPLVDGISRDSVLDLEFSPNALSFGQRSTKNGSSQQPQAECSHCANCGACLSVLRSSSRDASLCARRLVYNGGIVQTPLSSADRNEGKELSSLAHLYSAIRDYKSKDLVNMPFWLAEALRLDGWYLRSDIIWHKPNPMPESVTDRPTKAHEYIFLLSKQERYFYDAEAIKEPADPANHRDRPTSRRSSPPGSSLDTGFLNGQYYNWRNKRSVWTVATQPYAEAHFATFPEDLIRPCILAGSRPGDTVLDPFAGSGTTGKVAIECGRSAILIELSPVYVALARDRTNVTAGFF
jgi:DNA modification methylase